jgi:hypothetical protein
MMTNKETGDFMDAAPEQTMNNTQIIQFFKNLPMLFWRIEVSRNRIVYMNNHQIEALSEQTHLLLKNQNFAKELIFHEDYVYYQKFLQAVQHYEPSLAVFRIKGQNGEIHWLKIRGYPDVYDQRYYVGYMLEITRSCHLVRETIQRDAELETRIELVDHPVMLIDFDSKSVMALNVKAKELFGFKNDKNETVHFSALYHREFQPYMNRIYDEIIFEKKWEGPILYQQHNRIKFTGTSSIRILKIRDRRVLRVAIHHTDEIPASFKENKIAPRRNEAHTDYVSMLKNAIGDQSDMKVILEILLNHPFNPGEKAMDGIIYSDVYARKGKVTVYGAGEPLRKMEMGTNYNYKGTIAENIEQFNLEYLIVDDTMASIKAIDWALFIPYGIRSYFAKPFYERNQLRTVLILCSTSVGAFSEDKLEQYSLLFEPFLQGLANWRKAGSRIG